jgi:hypothetical protein
MVIGISTSTVSMSLEILLMMRPRGVVSKKDVGALMILATRRLCSIPEAEIVPMAMHRPWKSMKIPEIDELEE